jgi:hypothetical protein
MARGVTRGGADVGTHPADVVATEGRLDGVQVGHCAPAPAHPTGGQIADVPRAMGLASGLDRVALAARHVGEERVAKPLLKGECVGVLHLDIFGGCCLAGVFSSLGLWAIPVVEYGHDTLPCTRRVAQGIRLCPSL